MCLPPHSVMSKIIFCGLKNVFMSQPPVGQFATGVPSVDVSIVDELEEIALDTLARGMNHTLKIIINRGGFADVWKYSRDTGVGILGNPHTAVGGCKRSTIGSWTGICDGTPFITVCQVRTVRRIYKGSSSTLNRGDLLAAWVRV